MPTPVSNAYTRYRSEQGYPIVSVGHYQTGYRGDRDARGQLILSDHGHYYRHQVNTSYTASRAEAAAETPGVSEIAFVDNLPNSIRESAKSETYARLRGKLYQGSAALGVTFASVQQSREMISKRYEQLSLSATQLERSLAKTVAKRRVSRSLADSYLEWVFGWKPAFADIHAAVITVCQLSTVQGRIRASTVKADVLQQNWRRNYFSITERTAIQYRCTRSAGYRVVNPNVWLAERAGLLNPAAVAWDLVPWSFVVNMIVNTGQLVQSVTDFAGLEFTSSSTTETVKGAGETNTYRLPGYGSGSARSTHTVVHRVRNLNGVAVPSLVLKMPNVNWELAAIAASLFTQKFSKISSTITNLRGGI